MQFIILKLGLSYLQSPYLHSVYKTDTVYHTYIQFIALIDSLSYIQFITLTLSFS